MPICKKRGGMFMENYAAFLGGWLLQELSYPSFMGKIAWRIRMFTSNGSIVLSQSGVQELPQISQDRIFSDWFTYPLPLVR